MLATLTSARAGVAHIGRGLAEAQGLAPKHAIKQVDRLFRNELLSLEELALHWLEFVAENRTELVVARQNLKPPRPPVAHVPSRKCEGIGQVHEADCEPSICEIAPSSSVRGAG